jgi:hypothetical protein
VVSKEPRKAETKQRTSARLQGKTSSTHSRKFNSLKENNMPYMVKSSNSMEKIKLKSTQNPNKVNPKITKKHEASDNSKSKSSSTISL